MQTKQQSEWAEAQKIVISVDLVVAAKNQLKFLAAVDRYHYLYEGPAMECAIYRYNNYWLPLLAKYLENPISDSPLVVPLDCEWVWHCHRLNPIRYKSDCEKLFGRILGNHNIISSVEGTSKSRSKEMWNTMYPEEPYELDHNRDFKDVQNVQSNEIIDYDLASAIKRQSSFYFQVSKSYVSNTLFLEEAAARYKGFLHLIKTNKMMNIKRFCVPTYDIDLVWHSHQLHPISYCDDLNKILGNVLEHDDTDSDRTKGKKLDIGFSGTTKQWEDTFGLSYWKAGAMYKGIPPTPVTPTPLSFIYEDKMVHTPNDFDDIISLPQIKAIESIFPVTATEKIAYDKSHGHVMDNCGNDVVILEMRDYKKQITTSNSGILKEVLHIAKSGESHTLAEFHGREWLIKGTHGSMKLRCNFGNNDYLFDLLGNKKMRLFAGRKLDYEPRKCENKRREQDFITVVEFSAEYPYGKAVALIDFKYGILKVMDQWMIITGITLFYILCDTLKKASSFISEINCEGNMINKATRCEVLMALTIYENANKSISQRIGYSRGGMYHTIRENMRTSDIEFIKGINITSCGGGNCSGGGSYSGGGGGKCEGGKCSVNCGNMEKCSGLCGTYVDSADMALCVGTFVDSVHMAFCAGECVDSVDMANCVGSGDCGHTGNCSGNGVSGQALNIANCGGGGNCGHTGNCSGGGTCGQTF